MGFPGKGGPGNKSGGGGGGKEVAIRRDNAPAGYTAAIAETFDLARVYLDMRRDKEEAIKNLSRDITWESKKIIYLLHRYFTSPHVMTEAKERLTTLRAEGRSFFKLRELLTGPQDTVLHHRRFTSSIQEFVEAYVFMTFVEERRIPKQEEVQGLFTWTVPSDGSDGVDGKGEVRTIQLPVSVGDFILGVCDFTGEVMKAAVPTVTRPRWHGFLSDAFTLVREMYVCFAGLYAHHREFNNKLGVMRASVVKIEGTVYRLKVRVFLDTRVSLNAFMLNKLLTSAKFDDMNNSKKKGQEAADEVEDSGVE